MQSRSRSEHNADLVTGSFARIATTAIFQSGILRCEQISSHIDRAPGFWANYLAYLTFAKVPSKSRGLENLLLIAQHLCHYHNTEANDTYGTTTSVTEEELRDCVLELCRMVTVPLNSASHICRLILPCDSLDDDRTTAVWAMPGSENIDKDALQFKRNLLSAAAWMGEKRLVAKLLGDGYNWFSVL
jgi:hypothetical protein